MRILKTIGFCVLALVGRLMLLMVIAVAIWFDVIVPIIQQTLEEWRGCCGVLLSSSVILSARNPDGWRSEQRRQYGRPIGILRQFVGFSPHRSGLN